jgi:hypothetical protein
MSKKYGMPCEMEHIDEHLFHRQRFIIKKFRKEADKGNGSKP